MSNAKTPRLTDKEIIKIVNDNLGTEVSIERPFADNITYVHYYDKNNTRITIYFSYLEEQQTDHLGMIDLIASRMKQSVTE